MCDFGIKKCAYHVRKPQMRQTSVSKKVVRLSRNITRSSFSTYFECNHKPFSNQSNTFDCLSTEPIATPNPSCRAHQSLSDLTSAERSDVSQPARSLAFLWRRPSKNQAAPAPENCTDVAGSSVESIKQRWRRQQIEIQQKLAVPEKTSIWSMLTGSRHSLSRMTKNP